MLVPTDAIFKALGREPAPETKDWDEFTGRLQAVETVQPALANFYSSLSDDQKARFDGMGRQLFAQSQQ